MWKDKWFFQQCCLCLLISLLCVFLFLQKLFLLLQIAVKFENYLSVFYIFFRQNCFFAPSFFSIWLHFLMILSLFLGYSDKANTSELAQSKWFRLLISLIWELLLGNLDSNKLYKSSWFRGNFFFTYPKDFQFHSVTSCGLCICLL